MNKYKVAALFGTAIMGVGAFVSCLAQADILIAIGNILLVISILIMIYGYSKWQP